MLQTPKGRVSIGPTAPDKVLGIPGLLDKILLEPSSMAMRQGMRNVLFIQGLNKYWQETIGNSRRSSKFCSLGWRVVRWRFYIDCNLD
jgi:hypothetical protein